MSRWKHGKKIEVGEFGRTNYGKIIKFAWLEHSHGKRDESKVILINEDILGNGFYYFSIGESIVKHSKNLIDLIEIGDIVNGMEVLDIHKPRDLWEPIEIRVDSRYTNFILTEDIKTILTHEQFENNCYKVGGEDE